MTAYLRREQQHGDEGVYAGMLTCGGDQFPPYGLCYAFGAYLAMAEFNLQMLQQLLGHQDLRMTMHNSHLAAEHLHQAVNRWMW